MERPKSGHSVVGLGGQGAACKKRAKSWEVRAFDVREWCCRGEGRCEWCSLADLGSGSSTGFRPPEGEGRFSRQSLPGRRKGRSGGQGVFCSEEDVQKVRRSLRLVGLKLSDFGIYCGGEERSDGRRARARELSGRLRTKVAGRSVSLEWVRESVKRAWAQDGLDESHRRVLARAAYEEWCLRKEGELREKRKGERLRSAEAEGCLREELVRKKAKSEEEFDKWLEKKKRKRKGKQESGGKEREKPLRVLMKSKEEIEEAFLKWKKSKDEELEKRKREKKKEKEKEKSLEKQKAEKKAAAEKAFLQWKSKLEESEKAEEEKRRRRKKRQEQAERRRKEEKSTTSFQIWKEAKDHQMRDKMRQMRQTERAAREERLAQMEERMYEAEQAFEDWLDKVDCRKQKQFCRITTFQNPIPWIPA